MLAVKRLKLSKEDNAPSLDDFDREMEVYRVSTEPAIMSTFFRLFHLSDSAFKLACKLSYLIYDFSINICSICDMIVNHYLSMH